MCSWNHILRPLLVLLILLSMPTCSNKSAVQNMRRVVESQLPAGSAKAQVVRFLDDRKINHSDALLYAEDPPDPKYGRLRRMGGVVTNFFGSEPSIQLTFYFDQRDRLVKSEVKDAFGADY